MTTRIRPATWEECQAKRPDMVNSGQIPWPHTNFFWIITEGEITHRGHTASLGEIVFVRDCSAPELHYIYDIGLPVMVHDGAVEIYSGQAFVCGQVRLLQGTK